MNSFFCDMAQWEERTREKTREWRESARWNQCLLSPLRTRASTLIYRSEGNREWLVVGMWHVSSARCACSSVWPVSCNSVWASMLPSCKPIWSPSIVWSKPSSPIRICSTLCSALLAWASSRYSWHSSLSMVLSNGIARYPCFSLFSGFVLLIDVLRFSIICVFRSSLSSWTSPSVWLLCCITSPFFLNCVLCWFDRCIKHLCPPRRYSILFNLGTHAVASRAKMIIVIWHLIRCHRRVVVPERSAGRMCNRTRAAQQFTPTDVIQSSSSTSSWKSGFFSVSPAFVHCFKL